MALIRRFEEEAGRQYQRAKAGGFLHLAIGEEATIVGTTSVMRDDDYLVGTYRTHGHAIARGTNPKRVIAELFGRADGTSGGRGGAMHIFDVEHRFRTTAGKPGGGDFADLHAGHPDLVTLLQLLERVEAGDDRVALLLENLSSAEGLEGHPDQGDAEQEEKADAGGLLRVVHGFRRFSQAKRLRCSKFDGL
jgi:hypothetical protein